METGYWLVLGLGLLAVGGAVVRARSRQARLSRTLPCGECSWDLDALVSSLEEKALAYAVYREILEKGVPPAAKDALYSRFGYVNLPPALESDKIFEEHPGLMGDEEFLAALNRWIAANGGECKRDFFSASTEMGRILVAAKRIQAEREVEKFQLLGRA